MLSAMTLHQVFSGKYKFMLWPVVFSLLVLSSLSIFEKSMTVYDQIYERRNLYRTVAENHIEDAIVFIKTYSGTMHSVDLTRNRIDFSDDVLYVQTLGGRYGPLIRYYYGRNFYEYSYLGPGRLGKLQPLKTYPDGRHEVRVEHILSNEKDKKHSH